MNTFKKVLTSSIGDINSADLIVGVAIAGGEVTAPSIRSCSSGEQLIPVEFECCLQGSNPVAHLSPEFSPRLPRNLGQPRPVKYSEIHRHIVFLEDGLQIPSSLQAKNLLWYA